MAVRLRHVRARWHRHALPLLFILPTFLVYGIFVLWPFGNAIYYSLTDWGRAQPVKNFIGAAN